jgi:DNA-directed RNA polymerase subunit RPC12/RpoP
MVYCTKCGTKNEETAVHCVKCGAKLVSKDESWDKRVEKWGEDFGKRAEKWGDEFGKRAEEWGDNFGRRRECFGLPHGGIIFGLLIGAIIIIVGISALLTDSDITRFFWPLVIVVFGLLIATGALYSLIRRR